MNQVPFTAWRPFLAIAAVAVGIAVLFVYWVNRAFDATLTGEALIVYRGSGTQSTDPFYLAGGTYRTQWAAWERAPEYPPCTHSAELMTIEPGDAPTPARHHVIDLASRVQVPATGASVESYVINIKPGDYYFHVNSECAWQISIAQN